MEISVKAQTLVFLAACGFGMALGAVYDLFRIFRIAVPCGKAVVFIQDVLFWMICAVSSFLFLLYMNTGEIRLFIILGELIGATLYYFTLGVLVMKSAKAVVGFLRWIAALVFRLIARPLGFIGRKTGAFVSADTKLVGNIIKKKAKVLKTHLKVRKRKVYNLTNRQNAKDGGADAQAVRPGKRGSLKGRKRKRRKEHEKTP
ncbi:MAG: spore cortex biosynthesis protein YabQ [Clostridia bacterium]|nr:spore cortex biosynthesis protein YabQ [Clostridia bacterium]MDR3645008.1 spore cortex biosynthesis protein YabQ [Clostridia bacterium]